MQKMTMAFFEKLQKALVTLNSQKCFTQQAYYSTYTFEYLECDTHWLNRE